MQVILSGESGNIDIVGMDGSESSTSSTSTQVGVILKVLMLCCSLFLGIVSGYFPSVPALLMTSLFFQAYLQV